MFSGTLTMHPLLIFSDLDGTLLDHHNYSFEPVIELLASLKKQGVPVILNTSKTAAEVKQIRQEMDLDTPFIIENGAAVYIPKNTFDKKPKGTIWQDGYWVKTFASKRSHWTNLLKKLEKDFPDTFESFSQMSIQRISEVTGLDEHNASLAASRQFGEPLLWKSSTEQRSQFIEAAKKLGAYPLLGGRFLHIAGDTNKGKALSWLSKEYKTMKGFEHINSIALGDGNNDVAMLEAADIAIRISSPVNEPPILSGKNKVITSTQYGPEGWRECITDLLKL